MFLIFVLLYLTVGLIVAYVVIGTDVGRYGLPRIICSYAVVMFMWSLFLLAIAYTQAIWMIGRAMAKSMD